jgi:hypothetical protein
VRAAGTCPASGRMSKAPGFNLCAAGEVHPGTAPGRGHFSGMDETIFAAANTLALAGWILLAVFPRRRWAHWHVAGVAIPAALALAYVALLAWHAPGAEGGFSTLAGVRALFARDGVLLAGWLHYLAFDLFLGAWMCRRATAEALPLWRLYPALPLTFLAGPAGLLAFLALRALPARRAA